MNTAFEYARKQLFDMRFEPFTLRTAGVTYQWPGGVVAVVCRLLITIGLVVVARVLFARKVEVQNGGH